MIFSTVRAVGEGWVPFGDRAVIALRSLDVLSSHPPLVGQFTQWSAISGRATFSPGPLLYWLLAFPARLAPPAGLAVWMGAVNLAAVVGIVLLARRRGGAPLMFGTAIAVALMCRSLPSESLHDVWNPYAAPLPFLLLCFLAWSVACGEYRLLPLTILLASFVIQTHLAFLGAGVALLVVAVIGLAVRVRDAHSSAARDVASLRRWIAASLAAAAVVWTLPLANEVFRSGNLSLIADAILHKGPTLGSSAGWHTVVRAFGIPPWWVRSPVPGLTRYFELGRAPGWASQASCAVVVLALFGVLVSALRRRSRDTVALTAIAILLVVVLGTNTAFTPTSHGLALNVSYTMWWASLAGMFVWIALAWSLVTLIRNPDAADRVAVQEESSSTIRARLARPAALVAIAGVGMVVALGQGPDGDSGQYRPFGALSKRLRTMLPNPGAVLLTPDTTLRGASLRHVMVIALPSLVYSLRRDGATVFVPRNASATLGSRYIAGFRHYDHHVEVSFNRPPAEGSQVIATVDVRPPASPSGRYLVELLPVG